eukprot:TRINITY_DN2456_c0_g1_i1.p1 TRINITY_DN2456_c0_g1~~TRINITY_DN2456_c0_g1_i1.p1  ORF type:complete len:144 (+),score=27.13 TRINITY_DN2456_c0_g1_i1:503-934(+)
MTPVYYKGARAAVIVFDSVTAFESVGKWRADIEEKLERYTDTNIPILLLYNKSDLLTETNPGIPEETLNSFCEEYAHKGVIGWRKTSAKTGTNIQESFEHLLSTVVSQRRTIKNKTINPSRGARIVRVTPTSGSSIGFTCCSN